jgi:hypothetical protein
MLDFIPNGHRETVGFREVPNLHREFIFTYLPFRGTDSSEAFAGCIGQNGALDKAKHRAAILERLVWWDFLRPMDEAALRDMASPMFEKLEATIFGRRAPDFVVGAEAQADENTAENAEKDAA